jgi:pimeloyl-ACP methyl ester carboxylesterase
VTTTEWTPLPDGPLHAAVVGPPDAPTVVGVPGLGCSHHYFLPLARALAPEARTAVLDLPGFGPSPGPPRALDVPGLARALAAWLRATGRSGSVLVANSVGCAVALELAVQAPELMGPVVLAGPAIDPRSSRPLGPALRLLGDVRNEPRVAPRLLHDWLVAADPRRVLTTYRHALDHRIEEAAARVAGPAVVVAGEHDPIAPRGWAQRLTAALPRGRLVEVPGRAHALTTTAPDTLAAIVRPLTRLVSGEEC